MLQTFKIYTNMFKINRVYTLEIDKMYVKTVCCKLSQKVLMIILDNSVVYA